MASKDLNEISSNDGITMDGSCRIIQSEDELRILPSNMIINGWILLGKSAVELNVEASGEDSLKTGSGDYLRDSADACRIKSSFANCIFHVLVTCCGLVGGE